MVKKIDHDAGILFSEGIPKDLIDKYRDVVTVMDMKQDGDKWLITYDTGLGPPQSFTFILGQELVTKDLEGKGVKVNMPKLLYPFFLLHAYLAFVKVVTSFWNMSFIMLFNLFGLRFVLIRVPLFRQTEMPHLCTALGC